MKFSAVVIGASAGGIDAISSILSRLKNDFTLPIIIVQHIGRDSDGFLAKLFSLKTSMRVKELEEKEQICGGTVYLAPVGYHTVIEKDRTFSLTTDVKINYSRPSIDVLFESAAEAYYGELIGILLTGANSDGSIGLRKIRELSGLTIVQDPATASVNVMPLSAISLFRPHYILSTEKISQFLNSLI